VFPSGTTALELNEGHAGDHHAGVLIHSGPDGIEDLLDEFGLDEEVWSADANNLKDRLEKA